MSNTEEEIKVTCAWCGQHMSGPEECNVVSHGICEKCQKKELEQIKGKSKE